MGEDNKLSELIELLPADLREEFLRRLQDKAPRREEPKKDRLEPQTVKKQLVTKLALFSKKHAFKVGDFVQWKKGLKNRKMPAEGEPAIVAEVLQEPVFDPKDPSAASPYFREPLDIVLAILDEDGDFLTYHYDSRRFEPFPGSSEDPK